MNPFTWLYEFISNRQIRLTHRVSVIIVIIATIALVDDFLGVSNHLSTSYKLDEIQKIDQILANPSSDSVSKQYAIFQRERIMNKKTFFDYIFFRRSSWASWNLKNANTNNPAAKPNWSESNIKESLVFYITASGLIYVAGLLMVFFVLFSKSANINSLAIRIATSITILAFFIGVGSLFQKLLTLIPIIKYNPDYNYVINFVLQLLFLFGLISLTVYLDNRKKNKYSY